MDDRRCMDEFVYAGCESGVWPFGSKASTGALVGVHHNVMVKSAK